MGGSFQTTRDIFENPIWQNIVEFRLFILIYGKAAFKDEVIIGDMRLARGQWVRSYRNLQSDLEYIENNAVKRYSLSVIQRTIQRLCDQERITILPCKLGTLFTVLNYAQYQGFSNYQPDTRYGVGTALEQRWNNNKKEKKDKNIYHGEFGGLQCVYDYHHTLNLPKHKQFTVAMKKAIEKAMKENRYTVDDCKELLRRHSRVVELTRNKELPVTARGLDVFFGQKAYQATHLICSEYAEGGKFFELYRNQLEPQRKPTEFILTGTEAPYAE